MRCKWIIALITALTVQFTLSTSIEACSIGAADGTVTVDGRPILWKVRQLGWNEPNNYLRYFTHYEVDGVEYPAAYPYIGIASLLSNSNTGRKTLPMMSLNTQGLCTGDASGGRRDSSSTNGSEFMCYMIANFANVAEVRTEIQWRHDNIGSANRHEGSFPFMDAQGNATMFEYDRAVFFEYKTDNANRAGKMLPAPGCFSYSDPAITRNQQGWVVRSNHFHENADGTDDLCGGYGCDNYYYTGAYNVCGLIDTGVLSAQTLMQGNLPGPPGYELPRYGPGRNMKLLADPGTCSTGVFQGVLPGENPLLTTMWAAMGRADYSVAVPAWVAVTDIPAVLKDGLMSGRANSLHLKNWNGYSYAGAEAVTQGCTLPLEAHIFTEVEALLNHWRTRGLPPAEVMTRVEHRIANDAHSLLLCLDVNQTTDHVPYENHAPTADIDATGTGLTMDFTVVADDDGSVASYLWNFGDDETSPDQSPSHSYDAAGWYLVSCTVTDNEGVSNTDWQYYNIPEPTTLSLLGLAGLALLRRRKKS